MNFVLGMVNFIKVWYVCGMGNSNIVSKLKVFRQRDKFSVEGWNSRELNPSSDELCERLTFLFNDCADALIEAVGRQCSDRQLKSILTQHLNGLNRRDFDTEEREFIADLFYELSKILNIGFKHKLNSWMYGPVLAGLIGIIAMIRGKEKVVETLSQDCDSCNTKLETLIFKKRDDVPDFGWDIIQCNSCNEYNLLDKGPNVGYSRGNYRNVETLSKEEFTEEQALQRLEQIRFFRKQ